MEQNLLLPFLVLVPLLGAVAGAFVPAKIAKHWALGVCLVTLLLALALIPKLNFSPTSLVEGQAAELQWGKTTEMMGSGEGAISNVVNRLEVKLGSPRSRLNFHFAVLFGMDTISYWLVLLTVVLQPLAVLASYESIKDRPKEYYAWMLALLGAMIGCFISRDLLLFYIFFELTLVPMFFIIGIWGGSDRRYAAGKFFLFTFTGSVFTLAAVLYLGIHAGTFEMGALATYAQANLTDTERHWILLALLAGFAVKVPLFPVHTWLPLAHTEAPTAGSVILAGVLLKLGTYGLLRIALPLGVIAATPSGLTPSSIIALKVIAVLCVIGVIYGALVAWVQQDIKKLIAYSSVSHLGFCVLGMVSFTKVGLQGSVLYMINHGISTGAMFLVIGMIYDRFHTRDIDQLSGLGKKMPKMAFFFILFVMSSIGLPLTNGFVSEFLTILGAFTSEVLDSKLYGAFAATGVVLGAVYMLHLAARIIFGPLKYPGYSEDSHGHAHSDANDEHHAEASDLNGREMTILVPLAVAVLVLGLMPTFLTKSMDIPLSLITGPATMVSPAEKANVSASPTLQMPLEATVVQKD